MLNNFLSILKAEFAGYNAKKMTQDLLSGITVVAVALPLALALGVSSGASAASGLLTAIVAGLVIGGLSGGSYQISGASGAMTVILLSIAEQYGLQGVFVATALAGILLCLAGLLRLGRFISLIPLPVIVGFTSGSALIIALSQMDKLLGLAPGTDVWQSLQTIAATGQGLHPAPLLLGAAVTVFIFAYPKRLAQYCPASLVAIVLATAASVLLGLPVERVGEIPRKLLLDQRLDLTLLTPDLLLQLLPGGVSIAALGFIESLLCGAAAGRMKEEHLDSDQELIAQGVGNFLLPFLGGIPATAAIARSSVAIKAGGQTRMTSVFHAGVLLLSMFVLGDVMSVIPLSALAGVLMATAVRMNDWQMIREMFRKRYHSAILQFVVTVAATIVLNLTLAILIGVAVSVVNFVFNVSHLQVRVSDVDPQRLGSPYLPSHRRTRVLYLTGLLYFGTAGSLEEKLPPLGDADHLVISMRGVLLVDISGARALQDLCHQLQRKGITVHFSTLQPSVAQMLDLCGVTEALGQESFHTNVDSALASLA